MFIHKVWKNADAIGYVRICVDRLGEPQWAICANFGPQKGVFCSNYIRILGFMWGLGLVSFDSTKAIVSGKVLVFGNTLCFPEVNLA